MNPSTNPNKMPNKNINTQIIKSSGMFGFYFLKLLLKIVFENIEKNILVFSENCHCSLYLMFSIFDVFFRTKILGTRSVFKNRNQILTLP